METLKTIGIAFIISFIVVSGLNFLSNTGIGTTITQISGGDKLSDLDTLINTISSELNVGKMEVSTTTLPLLTTLANQSTTGTLTTGTWNADVLTVTYGGTGSSTLSANQVLLGNGTTQLAVVSGLGSSGQFLTSGGAGTPPTWTTSALNQADDFNWTGSHTFNSTVDIEADAGANFTINTVAYEFPSSDGSSGDVWTTNGSGVLSFSSINTVLEIDGTTYATSNTSTTTAKTILIPANTLGANDMLRIRMVVSGSGNSNQKEYEIGFGNGAATTTTIVTSTNIQGTLLSTVASIDVLIINKNNTSAQDIYANVESLFGVIAFSTSKKATTDTRDTTGILYLSFEHRVINGSDVSSIRSIQVEVLRN